MYRHQIIMVFKWVILYPTHDNIHILIFSTAIINLSKCSSLIVAILTPWLFLPFVINLIIIYSHNFVVPKLISLNFNHRTGINGYLLRPDSSLFSRYLIKVEGQVMSINSFYFIRLNIRQNFSILFTYKWSRLISLLYPRISLRRRS